MFFLSAKVERCKGGNIVIANRTVVRCGNPDSKIIRLPRFARKDTIFIEMKVDYGLWIAFQPLDWIFEANNYRWNASQFIRLCDMYVE
jgi:hypothetical protein